MLTTAKSIQLLDVSGMNISPITDITSLYYEVENPKDKTIISRKYVYDAFPVGVNINPVNLINIGKPTSTSGRHPGDGSLLYKNGQLYKIVDSSKNDILVSRIDTGVIPGTTLRELKVTNYNLSEILSYYTPLDLMDASCHALDVSINNINTSIRDISTRIHNLRTSLDAIDVTLSKIIEWSKNNLIPNKFYLIKDYYAGDNGCMALPNSNGFSGPAKNNSLKLLIKANDSANLDGKLYEMYEQSGKALKVLGTYKIEGNKIRITYMKDQYGNEAPYDFYNLKYKNIYTFGKNSINSNIQNNIIKTDPYTFGSMPLLSYTASNSILKNNYIGYDSSIYSNSQYLSMQNNTISNNCSIYMKASQILIYNNIIYNNNILHLHEAGSKTLKNTIINSSNNIIIKSLNLNNIIINSANNITLYNSASNVTILNNCDGSINLSDNIIVDNYINTAINSSLNTSPNSVYLFGQNVYARSFNTIQEKTLLYLLNDESTVATTASYDNITTTAIYDDIITQSAITNAVGGKSLIKCEIGNNVSSIEPRAFEGCTRLSYINISKSIKSIGGQAFKGCSNLSFVMIPNSVYYIGDEAFCDCINLKYIKYDGYRKDWYEIQLGGIEWNKNIPCKIVQCLDGDLYLNEYFYTIGVFDDIK